MSAAVTYVGAGPGDPALMTRAGRDALAVADVVVADRPSSDEIIDAYAPGAERVFVGRAPRQAARSVPEIADVVAELHGAGRRVVRLKSGDLFVCSRAAEELRALLDRGVTATLVPGVSAALAAPLAAGLALIDGDAGRFTVVAGNDDPAYPPVDWSALAAPRAGAVVVLMGRRRQHEIAEALGRGGRAADAAVSVVHAATKAGSAVEHTTVSALGRATVPAPTTVVVGARPTIGAVGAHP